MTTTAEWRRAYNALYAAAHREERRARDNARYARDRDRILEKHRDHQQSPVGTAYRKAYQEAHKGTIREYNREYQRKWREANRETFQRQQAEWYATHQDEVRAYREAHQAERRAAQALRRARKRAALVEAFNEADIYERDGWVCGLCREPVDPALVYPDLMRKSIDHILPLARGGEHSAANVQLAHLRCNIRKGGRDRQSQP